MPQPLNRTFALQEMANVVAVWLGFISHNRSCGVGCPVHCLGLETSYPEVRLGFEIGYCMFPVYASVPNLSHLSPRRVWGKSMRSVLHLHNPVSCIHAPHFTQEFCCSAWKSQEKV